MTAKEFIKEKDDAFFKSNGYYQSVAEPTIFAEECAIEFAKHHVELALGAASKNAKVGIKCNNCSEYHDNEVDEESILTSYSLNKIQ